MPRPKQPGAPWHGTAGGYINHGCRCVDCRAAHAKTIRDYRIGQKEKGLCVNCTRKATRGVRCKIHADARLAYAARTRRVKAV